MDNDQSPLQTLPSFFFLFCFFLRTNGWHWLLSILCTPTSDFPLTGGLLPRAVLCDGSMRPAISARHRSSVVRALVPSLSECWCPSFWWISTSPAFLLLIPFAPFPRPSQSVRSLERPLELLLPPPRPRRPLLYGSLLSLGVKRASIDVLLIFCCSFIPSLFSTHCVCRLCTPPRRRPLTVCPRCCANV